MVTGQFGTAHHEGNVVFHHAQSSSHHRIPVVIDLSKRAKLVEKEEELSMRERGLVAIRTLEMEEAMRHHYTFTTQFVPMDMDPFEDAIMRKQAGVHLDRWMLQPTYRSSYAKTYPGIERMSVPQAIIDTHLIPFMTCGQEKCATPCMCKSVLLTNGGLVVYTGAIGIPLAWIPLVGLVRIKGIKGMAIPEKWMEEGEDGSSPLIQNWPVLTKGRGQKKWKPINRADDESGVVYVDTTWTKAEIERRFWMVVFDHVFGCGWGQMGAFKGKDEDETTDEEDDDDEEDDEEE